MFTEGRKVNAFTQEVLDSFNDGKNQIEISLSDEWRTKRLNKVTSLRSRLKKYGYPVRTSVCRNEETGEYTLTLTLK